MDPWTYINISPTGDKNCGNGPEIAMTKIRKTVEYYMIKRL